MSEYIKLQTESILGVPFSRYEKNFTFNVNGEEYYTSQFFADLLSPTICKARDNDPTLQEFYIKTKSKGDFQQVLNLADFRPQEITFNNYVYLYEIFEQLGTQNVSIKYSYDDITLDNIISRIKEHERIAFLSDIYSQEVDFLSSHFSEILETKKEELLTVSNESLSNIMSNTTFILSTEDELLSFINELYTKDKSNSNLYEFVHFRNVSKNKMKEFIEIFDTENLTNGTWNSICARLVTEIKNDEKDNEDDSSKRYKPQKLTTTFSHKNQEFKGIVNHLIQNSNIKEEINITYSSDNCNGRNSPFNLIEYDKPNCFVTRDEPNSWICIEFKNHLIIPKSYTLRSNSYGSGHYHLKSWVIEGSMDNSDWKTLSEEKDSSVLNERNAVHTFSIQNRPEHEIKFIRLRQTGLNSGNDNSIYFNAIDFYGELIKLDK